MTIAIGQMNIRSADLEHNKKTMLKMIAAAKKEMVDVLVFPELSISGLLAGNHFLYDDFIADCAAIGEEIAALAQGITIIFTNVIKRNGKLHNACFMAFNGEMGIVEAPVAKSFVPGAYDMFEPETESRTYPILIDGKSYRTAFIRGDWRGLSSPQKTADVDLIINLSSMPLDLNSEKCSPFDLQRLYLQVNSCGLQNTGKANYIFPGASFLIDMQGKVAASAPYFKEKLAVWHMKGGDIARDYGTENLRYNALVYGIKNFCEQINISRAVIGISGGVDSALNACLYADALGADNLLLLSMPSKYNARTTKRLAEAVATGLGTHYGLLPIQESMEKLESDLTGMLIKGGGGAKGWRLQLSPLALENVQARERSARILAAAASAWDAIFTCNSNKAEITVGYGTFYGDMAGAFAATADLWKHQIYSTAAYAKGVFPQLPLAQIADLPPSAELSAEQNVDQGLGDPFKYIYHDYLFAAFAEEKASPFDILSWYAAGNLEGKLGLEQGVVKKIFADNKAFTSDLEYWWHKYCGTSVAKRLQMPPFLVMGNAPFGTPVTETMGHVYLSNSYQKLRKEVLK